MNVPVVSGLYAALYALLILALAINVIRLRRRYGVGIGDGGHEPLARACRAHANAVENIPMIALLLVLFELGGGPAVLVHAFGATLLLARIWHAYGLNRRSGVSAGRFHGTLATWLVILGLVGALILRAF